MMKFYSYYLATIMVALILHGCTKYFDNTDPVVQTFQVAGSSISNDALTTDKLGTIYASDNIGTSPDPFNGNGTTVYKITPLGQRVVFAENIEGPAGSCFDKWGNFFVCAFRGGKLIKIKPNGDKEVFAEGLEGPLQVVSDKQGNLL